MYLVYLGESGNTGRSTKDPNQPHHVHVGLMVHESQWVSINGEYNALFRRHFGGPPGEPGTPEQLRPADIHQGRGFFSSWTPARRADLIQECLNILIRRETPLIVAYIDKQKFAQAGASGDGSNALGQTPSEPAIGRLLFALHMFMDELNMSGLGHEQLMESVWPIANYALVVADEGKTVEPGFMAQFLKSELELPSPAVLESFCYVGAKHSVGTQLAHMCAYFVRRWLQNPAGSHRYSDALRDGKVIQVIYPVQL